MGRVLNRRVGQQDKELKAMQLHSQCMEDLQQLGEIRMKVKMSVKMVSLPRAVPE